MDCIKTVGGSGEAGKADEPLAGSGDGERKCRRRQIRVRDFLLVDAYDYIRYFNEGLKLRIEIYSIILL